MSKGMGLSPPQKIMEFFRLNIVTTHVTAGYKARKLRKFAWYSSPGGTSTPAPPLAMPMSTLCKNFRKENSSVTFE